MPRRETAPLGAPCWIELSTSDSEKSRAFYAELFGWTAEQNGPEFGGYINFSKDAQLVAGCMGNDGSAGPTDIWSLYLATADAKATVDAAVAHGGQAIVAAMEVMDLGTMAFVTDAGDAAVGAWQPGTHKGFALMAEPGAPAWFELHTRSYDAAVEFYRDVFGWDTHVVSDTPELRYTTFGEGEGQLAGIMDATAYLPEGATAHWAIYFSTADTDATVDKAVELGGAVVTPAEDTPYGRIAVLADNTGAMFRVVCDT